MCGIMLTLNSKSKNNKINGKKNKKSLFSLTLTSSCLRSS